MPALSPAATRARRHVPSEVVRFVVTVMIVAATIGAGGFIVLSQEATAEAQRNAEEVTRVQGLGVVQPLLSAAVMRGDAAALAELDKVVRGRVLDDRTVRVKIWAASGRILYSDAPQLIGAIFALGANETSALATNRVDSYVSDLSRPENRFERGFGELLEVYLPLKAGTGEVVLFETYQEFASVQAQQRRMLLEFGPVLVGGLLLLLILEAPLAWSMARRLEAVGRERELLLTRAVDASEGERRRIASDLHDGVVQRLAGTGMSLSAAAVRLDRDPGRPADEAMATAVRQGAAELREAVRELRTLTFKIAPAGLTSEGLPDALLDLIEPLRADGVETKLVFGDCTFDAKEARLVFRIAQEAVRNVVRHSGAKHVKIEVATTPEGRLLAVTDDGAGFDTHALAASHRDGHLGLALLHSLAEDGGATLTVRSASGEGTRVEMRLP